MKLSVSEVINCAHQLPGTALHGHTYRVTASVIGILGTKGMVKNVTFDALRGQLRNVLADIDHKPLEVVIGAPATAERLAQHIKKAMSLVVSIRVEVGADGAVETE